MKMQEFSHPPKRMCHWQTAEFTLRGTCKPCEQRSWPKSWCRFDVTAPAKALVVWEKKRSVALAQWKHMSTKLLRYNTLNDCYILKYFCHSLFCFDILLMSYLSKQQQWQRTFHSFSGIGKMSAAQIISSTPLIVILDLELVVFKCIGEHGPF